MDIQIKRALISVSDKSNVVSLATKLDHLGVEILSSGGTYKLLSDNGIKVREVAEHTAFPEIMGGRVKTLHPKIHGGILGRRNIDDEVMKAHNILPIDLVVVNLYPFQKTIAKKGCTIEQAIENIDIGGPAMIRAAAKNNKDVAVVVSPECYQDLIDELDQSGSISECYRFQLALKAFAHTAQYDSAITKYLSSISKDEKEEKFPNQISMQFNKLSSLRYGENPHQQAAFYGEFTPQEASVANAKLIQGKALSYNNIADADAALECVRQFDSPSCVIVKHGNPCGVAKASNCFEAYLRAFASDQTSAFGGIIAINETLEEGLASEIINKQFVEVIIAPTTSTSAKNIMTKKPNVRLLECGELNNKQKYALDYKRVNGGLLVQDKDSGSLSECKLEVVSKRKPTENEWRDLKFAWQVAKFVKSNAIVYANNEQVIGVGAGQMSRVYSAIIAGMKAKDEGFKVEGAVMASDAMFPFRDGIDQAAKYGLTAVIHPGGSIRDKEVIAAADEANLAMVFTGMRHFRH